MQLFTCKVDTNFKNRPGQTTRNSPKTIFTIVNLICRPLLSLQEKSIRSATHPFDFSIQLRHQFQRTQFCNSRSSCWAGQPRDIKLAKTCICFVIYSFSTRRKPGAKLEVLGSTVAAEQAAISASR